MVSRQGMAWGLAGMVVAVGLAVAGWQVRTHFLPAEAATPADAAPVAESPLPAPDVLYTWVDSQGVRHYAQEPRSPQAERVAYDGSRITPLPPADTRVVARLSAIAEPEPAAEENAKPQGSQMLHNLRKELQENQRRMQEAKSAMTNDL